MTSGDEGLVYELHFDQPIGDPENPRGQAQHYIGHTEDLDRRVAEHRGGHTAAILRAVKAAGICWRVVRTWPGTRDTERAIKDLHSGRRLCPECTEHPLTGAGAVARAAALRSEREAARAQVPEPPRPAPVPPYEAGRQMGRQFMTQQNAAGRSAAQIEATHEYITGPWHEMGHHTADQAERFRGYTELITAALGLIREAEAEGPHHEMEAEGGPAWPAGNELEEQMQYDADGNAAESAGYDAGAGPDPESDGLDGLAGIAAERAFAARLEPGTPEADTGYPRQEWLPEQAHIGGFGPEEGLEPEAAQGPAAESDANVDPDIEAAADLAADDVACEAFAAELAGQDPPWLQEVGERYQEAGERPSGWTADGEPEYEPDGNPSAEGDADLEPEPDGLDGLAGIAAERAFAGQLEPGTPEADTGYPRQEWLPEQAHIGGFGPEEGLEPEAAQEAAAEGDAEHDPGSWLARDGDGRVLEVDAEGHPGRVASPDDGRPIAEAESDTGQAYVAGSEEEFAAYWGGEGPAWEAQAEATTAEPAPGTGPHDVPWWDGERLASDRERTPERVAEAEMEAG